MQKLTVPARERFGRPFLRGTREGLADFLERAARREHRIGEMRGERNVTAARAVFVDGRAERAERFALVSNPLAQPSECKLDGHRYLRASSL
jgi:hypothetical protein